MNDCGRCNNCSPADTYIEWAFEEKCKQLRGGYDILTDWRRRKREYISYLATAAIDFPHFSRHDDTHSINILESIEMLLGKERIDKLSAGDLWMLLECAYMHDLGMALDYDELKDLWNSDDKFKKYIKTALLNGKDHSSYDGAAYYSTIDSFINKSHIGVAQDISLDELFPKHWPVELSRSISVLVADYIRPLHAKRISEKVLKLDKDTDPVIPKRLNDAVVTACLLHGENFDEILKKLCYSCKGFGNTNIHPRFAAAMLRIGDMLDLDNNRFNPRSISRFGSLPYVSLLHYKKHLSMSHVAISESRIEVTAESEDSDVCSVASNWLTWLSKETKDLICCWNDIVPEELKGCRLSVCKNNVYLIENGIKVPFTDRPEGEFTVNKSKLLEMMIGLNIYTSRLDFIREYLQNALDATKMQLWLDIKNGKYQFNYDLNNGVDIYSLTPYDIGQSIYDKYVIEVCIEPLFKESKIRIIFRDQGIGMEEDCLNTLARIGSGWRARERYNEDLTQMPKWLRPTGGFGIGVQSAFMVTDKVRIISFDQLTGKGNDVELTSPGLNGKNGGKIIRKSLESSGKGTIIDLTIDVSELYDNNRAYYEKAEQVKREEAAEKTTMEVLHTEVGSNPHWSSKMLDELVPNENKYSSAAEYKDPFSNDFMKEYISKFVCNYIKTFIPFSLVPIRIIWAYDKENDADACHLEKEDVVSLHNSRLIPTKGEVILLYKSNFYPKKNYWLTKDMDSSGNGGYYNCQFNYNGTEYLMVSKISNKPFEEAYLWDINNHINFYFGRSDLESAKPIRICFKNVLVKDAKPPFWATLLNLAVSADFNGHNAENIIKIHREAFKEEFERYELDDYYKSACNAFVEALKLATKKYGVMFYDVLLGNYRTLIQRIAVLHDKYVLDDIKKFADNSEAIPCTIIKSRNYDDLDDSKISLRQFAEILSNVFSSPDGFIVFKTDLSLDKPHSNVGDIAIAKLKGNATLSTSDNVADGNNTNAESTEQLITNKDRLSFGSEASSQSIIERALNSDEVTVLFGDVAYHLSLIPGMEKSFFTIRNRLPVYACMRMKPTTFIGEQTFFEDSYKKSLNNNKRYFATDVPNNFYPDIQVDILPFSVSSNGRYIISPIDSVVYALVSDYVMAHKSITKEKFVEIVKKADNFERLVDYVYGRQQIIHRGKQIEKDAVYTTYIEYIEKIFFTLKDIGFFEKLLAVGGKTNS